MKDSKPYLLEKCLELGIKVTKSMNIKLLNEKIQEYGNVSKSITYISSSYEEVKYVYHVADIHIRYLDRHEEYKEVFSRLVDYISNDPNIETSIMVI